MISVVLPVYEEKKIIEDAIEEVYQHLDSIYEGFELIVGDDGSTDSSPQLVRDAMQDYEHLRMVRNPTNQGRGAVLERAFKAAKGDIVAYIDADLEIEPSILYVLISSVRRGDDIAIGSKHMPESKVSYKPIRRMFSIMYNLAARMLLCKSVRDFQCGSKAFRRNAIIDIIQHTKTKGWSWDTEVIMKAKLMGYKLSEFPVVVNMNEDRRSKVSIVKAVLFMGSGLIRFWMEKLGWKYG